MLTRRVTLLAFALLFVVTALSMATAQSAGAASADPAPEFPRCVRVPVAEGKVRLYFAPGTLYEATPTTVLVGRNGEAEGLKVRGDGVWVGTVAATPLRERNHHYFTVGTASGTWGAWTKCRKVRP